MTDNSQRTMETMLIPEIPNPVRNLMAANMEKLYEKALAKPKRVVIM